MRWCAHESVRCLNHYDTFRKYFCEVCGRVYVCDCERQLATAFLPYQTREGREYGTHRRFQVDGFASAMCAECRGEPEEAHPRAAIWGQKGKVERFYWREIFKTQCELASAWLAENGQPGYNFVDFQARFPQAAAEFKKKAKRHWQEQHRRNAKYDLSERTESHFLSGTHIPVLEVEAPYIQVEKGDQKVGKWIGAGDRRMGAEQLALEWFVAQGFRATGCERVLISCWFGTFLASVVQDPADPRQQQVTRGSTKGWRSRNPNTPLISFSLPEDFGSQEYFERRRDAFEARFRQLRQLSQLVDLFDELLPSSELLRDYLWANDDESIATAREALTVVPPAIVLASLAWTAGSFWKRQPGWPDLFVYRGDKFRFVEVKSPHDRLSQEQMRWFEWAIDVGIPCQLMRIKRGRPSNEALEQTARRAAAW